MPISRTSANHNMNLGIDQDLRREIVANVYEDSAILQLVEPIEMTSAVQDIVTGGAIGSTAELSVPEGDQSTTFGATKVAEAAAKPESTGGLSTYQLVANKMATFIIFSDELLAETDVDLITYFQDALEQKMAFFIDKYALRGGGPFGAEAVGGASVTQIQRLSGASTAAVAVIGDDFTNAFNKVEAVDYLPNGWVLQRALKGTMRLLKTSSTSNEPLLSESMQTDIPDALWGEPTYFLGRGVFPAAGTVGGLRGVVGDWSQYVVGVRDNLSFSLHTEGTVAGVNLLETNQVALRAEMRIGAKLIDPNAFTKILNPAT